MSEDENNDPAATLELYRVAAQRLEFQDSYLFKFTAVFMTVHGALGALAQAALFGGGSPNMLLLGTVSAIGFILALLWLVWTNQNDYWHSVWVGALRNIESRHLRTKARVYAANHDELAAMGGRKRLLIAKGHSIAMLLPAGVAGLWLIGFGIAAC